MAMTPEQVNSAQITAKQFAEQARRKRVPWLFPALFNETFSLIFLPHMKNGYVPVLSRLSRDVDQTTIAWTAANLPEELLDCDDIEHPPANMSMDVLVDILENIGRGRTLYKTKVFTAARRSALAAISLTAGIDGAVITFLAQHIMSGDYQFVISGMVIYVALIVLSGIVCSYDLHWRVK